MFGSPMRSFSRRDMLRVGLLAAPVALHPLRVRAQEFGVAQVAGSGIPRTASQEKKLYLLLSLDARTFKNSVQKNLGQLGA